MFKKLSPLLVFLILVGLLLPFLYFRSLGFQTLSPSESLSFWIISLEPSNRWLIGGILIIFVILWFLQKKFIKNLKITLLLGITFLVWLPHITFWSGALLSNYQVESKKEEIAKSIQILDFSEEPLVDKNIGKYSAVQLRFVVHSTKEQTLEVGPVVHGSWTGFNLREKPPGKENISFKTDESKEVTFLLEPIRNPLKEPSTQSSEAFVSLVFTGMAEKLSSVSVVFRGEQTLSETSQVKYIPDNRLKLRSYSPSDFSF